MKTRFLLGLAATGLLFVSVRTGAQGACRHARPEQRHCVEFVPTHPYDKQAIVTRLAREHVSARELDTSVVVEMSTTELQGWARGTVMTCEVDPRDGGVVEWVPRLVDARIPFRYRTVVSEMRISQTACR